MPMSQPQVLLKTAQTASANNLADKIAAFTAASTALKNAQTAEAAAKAALDTAWTDCETKVGAYKDAVMVAPEGYMPPSG